MALGKYYTCYVDSSSLLFMNEDTYTAVLHCPWGYFQDTANGSLKQWVVQNLLLYCVFSICTYGKG